VLFGGGVAVGLLPLWPVPVADPLMSGLLEGGVAASGLLDGETGVTSGFVLGTVLGLVFGVKSGFVPGVRFGFGVASGAVAGGIVLFGLVGVLLGAVSGLGLVLWVPF